MTGPLLLQLKLCGVAAVIATSPYWLYQIWAFILPGLHPSERKWSRVFAAIAGPLFFAGVATAYFVLPKAHRGADRVHPGRRDQPGRLRPVLLVHHPHVPGLRDRLRDPAVRGHAQPGRRGLRQGAGPVPAVDRHRHLRLRRRRHAVDRPVLDAHARGADAGAVRDRRGHRPARRPGAAAGPRTAPTSGPTTRPRRCDRDPRARPVRPAGLAGGGRGRLGLRRRAAAATSCAGCLTGSGRARSTCCRATCSPSTRPTRRRWSTRRSAPACTRPGGTDRCCCSSRDDRATVATPGTSYTADLVLEAFTRVARAVGADPRGRLDSAAAADWVDPARPERASSPTSLARVPREIALLTNPTAGKGRGGRARGAVLDAAARRRAAGPRPERARRRRGARPGPGGGRRRGRGAGGPRRRRDGPPRRPGGRHTPAPRWGSSRPAPATTWRATSTSRARTRSPPRTG